jgi:hypothetical protein
MAMWVSPFIAVVWIHGLLLFRPLSLSVKRFLIPTRPLAFACIGYLFTYVLLFVGRQLYYGNLADGQEGSVAAAVSDWALSGALLGSVLGWARRSQHHPASAMMRGSSIPKPHPYGWIALWLLGYLAVSLSGFGDGWFLKLGPQRLQVFLWLPICIYAALGLERLRPASGRLIFAFLLLSGAVSVLVATFAFQGPLGRAHAHGPFAELHPEIMTRADANILEQLGEGVVLTPPPMSDVIVIQRGNPVVFGIASFNLSDRPFVEMSAMIRIFFAAETTNEERRKIATDWCVDYIYCPDTWPIDAEVRAQLTEAPWLQTVAQQGRALLLKSIHSEE